jgi:hypothetical protein
VRKIISILIALGLVLGLSVIATPVAAAVTAPVVTVAPNCACVVANYTIVFNITASLTEGYNKVCVEFPAGTVVPTTFANGAITINTAPVFGTEVTVTGQKVCFLVPADLTTTSNPITVVVTGIKNPCTAGPYTLKVNTDRAPDSTQVASASYTIAPAISVYGFVWDSNPTYPGIAVGFVPPFKACGQNTTGAVQFSPGKFQNAFNLTLMATTVGCSAPCSANVTMNVTLTAAPALSTVTLNLTGTPTWGGTLTPAAPSAVISTTITLDTNTTIPWAGLIHFDTVGTYQICFDVICPAGALVCPVCSSAPTSVVHQCFDFKVYQWKDAQKITLQEKWNLISLPLVPLVGASAKIDDLILSIPAADRAHILSIWNYDCSAKAFAVWGNGQTGLTTMADGKAYWVRVDYPLTNCGNITWWVFGTQKPMPPASPAAYPVCAGWNMVGYLGTGSLANAYLWNWAAAQPVIYGWTQGCWNTQGWSLIPFGSGSLVPGQGYWMAFAAAGSVYVP